MIALLRGEIVESSIKGVVIDASGVGFGVMVSNEDQGGLPVGTPALLYIFEYIREQAHDLYGFRTRASKALFEQLLEVNGVGPRMALALLNIGTTDQVKQAIAEGNTKYIQAAQGVGKRVAERVIVDLKDKVGLAARDDATSFLQDSAPVGDEAAQALISLGFTAQDALLKLKGIDPELSVEERIRLALKGR